MMKNRINLIFCLACISFFLSCQRERPDKINNALPYYEIVNEELKQELANYLNEVPLSHVKEKLLHIGVRKNIDSIFYTLGYCFSTNDVFSASTTLFVEVNGQPAAVSFEAVKTMTLPDSTVWKYLKGIFTAEYKDYIGHCVHKTDSVGNYRKRLLIFKMKGDRESIEVSEIGELIGKHDF